MSDADDADDDDLCRQIKERFASGMVFTDDELLGLMHERSLEETALFVTAYQNEATAFTLDPDLGAVRALELAAVISQCLSEPNRAVFQTRLEQTVEGCAAQDDKITTRLPAFDYLPTGGGFKIEVTFREVEE